CERKARTIGTRGASMASLGCYRLMLESLQTISIMLVVAELIDLRPVVKWAGGKQSLAPVLAQSFPKRFDTYYEPFLGGASVLLELRPSRAVVCDANEWLLDTYEAIREDYRRVVKILDALVNSE